MGFLDSRMVVPEHLQALCPELRAVVADAEEHGNSVRETWTGFGNAVALRLARPVLVEVTREIQRHLRYEPVNDPHYWLGGIQCVLHREGFVALPFDGWESSLPEGIDDLAAERFGP